MSIRVRYPDDKRPEDITPALEFVVASMMPHVGMTHITEENFQAFRYRINMSEQITGDKGYIIGMDGSLRQLTEDELRLFIGSRWNISNKSDAGFNKDISKAWQELTRDRFLRKNGYKLSDIQLGSKTR